MEQLPPTGPSNPSREPPAAGLDGTWLAERSASEGTLRALHESRAWLADPTSHLGPLDATRLAFFHAHDAHATPDVVVAAAQAEGGPTELLAAIGAALEARPDALHRARVLIDSMVKGYVLQALFFGLHHKLGAGEVQPGRVPSTAQLVEVWPRVHQEPRVRRYLSARVPDALLGMLAQRGPVERVGPGTLPAVRASLAAGVPVLCAASRQAFLVAAAQGDALIRFDVIAGGSVPTTLDGVDEISVVEA
jgi:hypothetical protein